jgi:uncharacterized protein (DUF2344 family)
MDQAEYLITIQVIGQDNIETATWQQWVDSINNSQEILWSKTTKSGKKQEINLRDRLFSLSLESIPDTAPQTVILRFTGSCRNDGTNLSPDNLVYMLEQVANIECQLLQVHRQQLILNPDYGK